MTLLIGTHFYDGNPDATRRQAKAMDALEALPDTVAVDLQWRDAPSRRPWLRTVPALRADSTSLTGCAGRPKPIASEVLDTLASLAEREHCRYFAFFNSDIVVTPAARALIGAHGEQGYAFSRMDEDSAGRDLSMTLAGVDAFAFEVSWWTQHRRRFRPYILGEHCWDNVYAAILMCHGRGVLVNRDAAIRHEVHDTAWGTGPFAEYNGFLAALDSRYFSLWATYYRRLVDARARGASAADERALAAEAFAWRPSPAAAAWHAGRCVKARMKYRLLRVRWPQRPAPALAER